MLDLVFLQFLYGSVVPVLLDLVEELLSLVLAVIISISLYVFIYFPTGHVDGSFDLLHFALPI